MSVTTKINTIDQAAANYAPAILTGIIAVEQAAKGLPGDSKASIVINTIAAGAQAAQGVPVPSVQGIAALVNLMVAILNAAGLFKHSTPQPSN